MKRFLLIMVCILFAAGTLHRPAKALARKILSVQQIDLQGKLKKPGSKSEAQPVEVFQTEYDLQVNFLATLGDLDIEALNEDAQSVFQTSVNAAAGGKLIIDTRKWKQGTYFLRITDDEGGYLEGKFEIN